MSCSFVGPRNYLSSSTGFGLYSQVPSLDISSQERKDVAAEELKNGLIALGEKLKNEHIPVSAMIAAYNALNIKAVAAGSSGFQSMYGTRLYGT